MRNLLLDGLTLSSGAVDAISFLGLGKVFTAFMTGNIAFAGMLLAGSPVAPRIGLLLASMGGYAAGIYLATRIIVRGSQPTTLVWPRATTVALGVSLLPHVGFALIWFANGGKPDATVMPVLLALWAMAMGMQSAAVRTLHVEGVFTTAATATIIFLAGDITNWSATVVERRRFAGVLVSLFVGATAGGLLLVHAHI